MLQLFACLELQSYEHIQCVSVVVGGYLILHVPMCRIGNFNQEMNMIERCNHFNNLFLIQFYFNHINYKYQTFDLGILFILGQYVRMDAETKMGDVLHLLLDVWDMKKPNLLISVIGGTENFRLKSKLKDIFRRGMIKASKSTGLLFLVLYKIFKNNFEHLSMYLPNCFEVNYSQQTSASVIQNPFRLIYTHI